jgi:hypothetical protein
MKNCHRDKKLDSLIGKIVKITFIDGQEEVGELIWVEKITKETPYKPQMYHCGGWSFYKSHVKSVVSMEGR